VAKSHVTPKEKKKINMFQQLQFFFFFLRLNFFLKGKKKTHAKLVKRKNGLEYDDDAPSGSRWIRCTPARVYTYTQ
jgi:hypothetical protein